MKRTLLSITLLSLLVRPLMAQTPDKKYQTPQTLEEQNQQRVLAEAESKRLHRSYEGFNKMNTWSVSVHGGVSKFYGDLQTGNFFATGPGEKVPFFGGISVNKQLSHIFGVSAEFGIGQISGSKDRFTYTDHNSVSPSYSYVPSYFNADVMQGALTGSVNLKSLLFGTRKLRRFKFDVFAGVGFLYYDTRVYSIRAQSFVNSLGENITYEPNDQIRFSNGPSSSKTAGVWGGLGSKYTRDLVIPTGVHLVYEWSNRLDIGIRYSLNHTFSEKLDMTLGGYDNSSASQVFSSVGNTSFRKGESANDKYGTLGLEITYKFGKKAASVKSNGKYAADRGQIYHLRWTDPKDLIPAPYNPTVDTALARVKAIMPGEVDPRLYTDTDGDGVADLFDQEPNTPANSIVSGSGVAMNLQQLLQPFVDAKVPKDVCTQIFGNVEFKTDQATIQPQAKRLLDDVISYLNNATECRVVVVGHTDRRASDSYNMKLSRRRTQAVKKYLTRYGLKDPSRVTIEWYGEFRPVAPNDRPDAGMQRNRRVELRILPLNNWKNYPGN